MLKVKVNAHGMDESEFWEEAAEAVFSLPRVVPEEGFNPTIVKVVATDNGTEIGSQTIAVTARGTYRELNGAERPSPFVVYEAPSIPCEDWADTREGEKYFDAAHAYKALREVGGEIRLPASKYDPLHLVYCSPHTKGGHGSYKFYHLEQDDEGMCAASYGRIGGAGGAFGSGSSGTRYARPIPSWMFWLRYQEKLAKGYRDVSDVYLADPTEGVPAELLDDTREEAVCEDAGSLELFELLAQDADEVVNAAALCGAENVTWAMVEKSRELIGRLSALIDGNDLHPDKVDEANSLIIDLMCVSPRRAEYVDGLLVKDEPAISAAIARETALADALEGAVIGHKPNNGQKGFTPYGIEVRAATEEEREHVLSLMLDPYTGKDEGGFVPRVNRVWRVEPASQRKLYESYCDERSIADERELFHGSTFGSWLSCITGGLSLRYANGGMFGSAHYFANQFRKSSGYTDGSWWGRGGAARRYAYVGVYDVAYGKPMEVHSSDYRLTLDRVRSAGCDCVHARKGTALRNDEIMVYEDTACCIKYLIEYAC